MKKYKERIDKENTLTVENAEPQDSSGTRHLPHSRLYLIGQNAFMFAVIGSLGGCVYGLFMLNYEIGSYTPVYTSLAFAVLGAIFGTVVGIFTKQEQ